MVLQKHYLKERVCAGSYTSVLLAGHASYDMCESRVFKRTREHPHIVRVSSDQRLQKARRPRAQFGKWQEEVCARPMYLPSRCLPARSPTAASASFPRSDKLSGRATKNKGQLASFGTWTQVWSAPSVPLAILLCKFELIGVGHT